MRGFFQASTHQADINGQTITVRSDETLLQAALRLSLIHISEPTRHRP